MAIRAAETLHELPVKEPLSGVRSHVHSSERQRFAANLIVFAIGGRDGWLYDVFFLSFLTPIKSRAHAAVSVDCFLHVYLIAMRLRAGSSVRP